jgi:hypothetical protein
MLFGMRTATTSARTVDRARHGNRERHDCLSFGPFLNAAEDFQFRSQRRWLQVIHVQRRRNEAGRALIRHFG